MSVNVELPYNESIDTVISQSTVMELGGKVFYLSAGTIAGRRQPEDPLKPNEDAYSIISEDAEDGLGPDYIALATLIADGASSQKPIPELGDTSGARFASHTLKELFETQGYIGEAVDMLQGLNRSLGERLLRLPSVDYTDMNSLPTSTGTINRIDVKHDLLDIAHVGDTFTIVQYENDETELLTDNLHKKYDQEVLQLVHAIAIENGITPREARLDPRVRTAIMTMFQTTRNRPDGTGEGMINGDPNMDRYIHSRSISLKGVKAILSGCDGLVAPGMNEANPDDRKRMFDIALTGGVSALIEHANYVADSDPDRWHLRFKHMDDSSGTLIQSPSWRQ
jgi:hypothetical protein